MREERAAFRAVVIGLGEAGAGIHLPALRQASHVIVAGGCDHDLERRNRVGARWNMPVFATHDELLASIRPDFVVVASPPEAHVTHCLAALEAGAHVLCEKPLASSVDDAATILTRAATAGRQVAVNHEFRAMPIFQAVIDAVTGEGGGGPTFAQAWQLIDHSPAREPGWRGRLKHRTLYEAGVHLVDLLTVLFGESPERVRASVARGGEDGPFLDAIADVTLEFSRGRLAHLLQNRIHRGDRQYLELRADTPQASYRASFGGRARLSAGLERSTRPHLRAEWGSSGIAWRERGTSRSVLARNPADPLIAATRAVMQACVDAIAAGRPVPFPGADGLRTLRVISAAYLAAESGRTVDLDGPDAAAVAARPMGGAGAA